MDGSARPRLLPCEERPFHWGPRSHEPGYGRVLLEGASATNFAVNVVVVPVGQGCPRHDFGGDAIVYGLEGAVEFDFGDERLVLRRHDVLTIPPNTFYAYRNAGLRQATMLSAIGRVDQWPASSRYDGLDGVVIPR